MYMLELCTRHAPGAQIPGPALAPLPPVRGPGLQELLPHPPQPAAPRHPAPPGGVGGVQGIGYCGTVHNLFWCPRNVVLCCTGHQVLWCPLFSAPNTVVFRAPGTEAHLVLHSGPLLPHPDEGDPGGLLAGAEDRGDGGLERRQETNWGINSLAICHLVNVNLSPGVDSDGHVRVDRVHLLLQQIIVLARNTIIEIKEIHMEQSNFRS